MSPPIEVGTFWLKKHTERVVYVDGVHPNPGGSVLVSFRDVELSAKEVEMVDGVLVMRSTVTVSSRPAATFTENFFRTCFSLIPTSFGGVRMEPVATARPGAGEVAS